MKTPYFICILFVLQALLTTTIADDNRDFYKILGIKRSAKEKEIKKAFKKLSLKLHPDKNPNDENALKKYTDLSAAYDVLGDAEKRRKYDKCGEKCVNEQGGGGGFDPFADFFGFHGGGQQQQERTGPTMTIKLKVSLADLYNGKDMEVKYTRSTICPHCRGSGADNAEDVKTCPKCNGQGHVIQTQQLGPGFVQQFQVECDKCQGEGQVKTSVCHMCRATKTKQALDELYIFIEKGTPDGYEERFRDAADEYVNVRAGEVIMKIVQVPHATFTREGENLKMDYDITLRQALLGFQIELEHLDGHKFTLSKQPGQVTQSGEIQRVVGEGMPKYGAPSDFGDLFVTYHVKSPTSLDDGQRTMLRQFFTS